MTLMFHIYEKWAVYSRGPYLHKMTGKLDVGSYSTIGYSDMLEYICNKHHLNQARLQDVNLYAIHHHLSTLTVHSRASLVKMMHGWIPTYSQLCRQGREQSSVCPRCRSTVETFDHVFVCPDTQAIESRRTALYSFLSMMTNIGTPIYVLTTIEYKLSILFSIEFIPKYSIASPLPLHVKNRLIEAIRHQNILGWDNFICGYSSRYWDNMVRSAHGEGNFPNLNPSWDIKLVSGILQCSQIIWQHRNRFLHGENWIEAKQLKRNHILDQVRQIYHHPPYLHSRFPPISTISLEIRLKRSTTNLEVSGI